MKMLDVSARSKMWSRMQDVDITEINFRIQM